MVSLSFCAQSQNPDSIRAAIELDNKESWETIENQRHREREPKRSGKVNFANISEYTLNLQGAP